MIDREEYGRYVARASSEFILDRSVYKSGTEAISKLSDEEITTCAPSLSGYSLDLKKWGMFSVVNITEVEYDSNAFHGLVLPEKQKKLTSSLLERQDNQLDDRLENEFDDLVKGKGKGLIFLLHGPTGVGKTYTAGSYYLPDSES